MQRPCPWKQLRSRSEWDNARDGIIVQRAGAPALASQASRRTPPGLFDLVQFAELGFCVAYGVENFQLLACVSVRRHPVIGCAQLTQNALPPALERAELLATGQQHFTHDVER